jgi:hypothetical protein
LTKEFLAAMKQRMIVLVGLVWLLLTGMAALIWRVGFRAAQALAEDAPPFSEARLAAEACQMGAYIIAALAIVVCCLCYSYGTSTPIEPTDG